MLIVLKPLIPEDENVPCSGSVTFVCVTVTSKLEFVFIVSMVEVSFVLLSIFVSLFMGSISLPSSSSQASPLSADVSHAATVCQPCSSRSPAVLLSHGS